MPKFFVNKEQIEKQITILEEDAKHIKTVLRKKEGEKLIICDGEGIDYICSINCFEQNTVIADIIEKQYCESEPPIKISLFQGLPKADKMELIIQKCVRYSDYVTVYPAEGEKRTEKIRKMAKNCRSGSKTKWTWKNPSNWKYTFF